MESQVYLLVILASISCASMAPPDASLAVADKPHILFMLVDDWGWANVGYHRDPPTKEVVTQNFDVQPGQGRIGVRSTLCIQILFTIPMFSAKWKAANSCE